MPEQDGYIPNLENTVYQPNVVKFGDVTFENMSDYRTINLAMLAPLTLDAKYPNRPNPLKKGRVWFYVDTLSPSYSDPAEALHVLKHTALFIAEKTPNVQLKEEVDALLQKYEIDPSSIGTSAVNAVRSIVADLHLPETVAKKLLFAINQTVVNFNYGEDTTATMGLDRGKNIDERVVTIDLTSVIESAISLSDHVGVEITGTLLETYITARIAHELGHVIDSAAYWDGEVLSRKTASRNIPDGMSKYPITYEQKTDLMFARTNMNLSWSERFANYFERAAVEKLGLSTEALDDLRRLNLTDIFSILSKVPPNKLARLLSAARKDLDEDDPVRVRIEADMEALLSGHAIAQCFPFNKEEIFLGLISTVMTPQERLDTAIEDQIRLKRLRLMEST